MMPDAPLPGLSASPERDIFILNERSAERTAALYDISTMREEIVAASTLKATPQRAWRGVWGVALFMRH